MNSSGYLSSEYNSLQVAFNRQFSKGLLLKGAYTWSHAIDYTDDDGWAEMSWYGDQFHATAPRLVLIVPMYSSLAGFTNCPSVKARLT